MQTEKMIRWKASNFFHSAVLFLAIAFLFAFLGWIVAGTTGLIFLTIFGMLAFSSSSRFSAKVVLKAYRARLLTYAEAPQLLDVVQKLAARAGLARAPAVYYIPSTMVNAFSVGRRDDAAIGVTDGILRNLNLRELTGVLAHEISHIRNNDLYVMGLADMLNRTTSMLSLLGQLLLLVNLPLIFYGNYQIPWLFILLLIFAPTISAFLQLGLSRSREYQADLDAARLTGDPKGLAAALVKLERLEAGFLERIFLPGRRIPEPSLLRTHPHTEDRVKRLLELEEEVTEPLFASENDVWEPEASRRDPRWRYLGFWY